ncbi:hypothetical protein FD21_GL001682 [Liquorilactobacillus vini DSM 20605]|uniref:Uncharacterized protein n=1 Tax=Liquorilactobacillus vini DSM 20605 TaxID=1133569 RepID=A0A0R2C367_9LACO|nr:hypothetical protein FD21_GL001682 [Liquorilactobacillus vini DSM 20605]
MVLSVERNPIIQTKSDRLEYPDRFICWFSCQLFSLADRILTKKLENFIWLS